MLSTIKLHKMTVAMVVKWLKMSDIHLIITHLHQAVVDYYWGGILRKVYIKS